MNQEAHLHIDTSSPAINRNHKDSLFRKIFSEKEDLLELYNAVNGSHHQDLDSLRIYTLEDAIYISYKNDISFLLDDMINLYEHQSTKNPNMPIRGLIYLARNYDAYISEQHLDIYSSVLQKLPMPQYIIFYNGTENAPERQYLDLTDAFYEHPGKEPCLNCRATLLNINYGHNQELMEHCRRLKEYSLFIHHIRMNVKNGLTLSVAIHTAIETCIKEHVLEAFLIKHYAEVESMVLTSFDQENHDRILQEYYRKEGFNDGLQKGRTDGRNDGRKEGRKEGITSFIADKLEDQIPDMIIIQKLCKFFHMPEDEAEAWLEEAKKLKVDK